MGASSVCQDVYRGHRGGLDCGLCLGSSLSSAETAMETQIQYGAMHATDAVCTRDTGNKRGGRVVQGRPQRGDVAEARL